MKDSGWVMNNDLDPVGSPKQLGQIYRKGERIFVASTGVKVSEINQKGELRDIWGVLPSQCPDIISVGGDAVTIDPTGSRVIHDNLGVINYEVMDQNGNVQLAPHIMYGSTTIGAKIPFYHRAVSTSGNTCPWQVGYIITTAKGDIPNVVLDINLSDSVNVGDTGSFELTYTHDDITAITQSPVYAYIIGMSNISVPDTEPYASGAIIPYTILNSSGEVSITFILRTNTSMASNQVVITRSIQQNLPPDISNVSHNMPSVVTRDLVVDFAWDDSSFAPDPDNQMDIVSLSGASASKTANIERGEIITITVYPGATGVVALRWLLHNKYMSSAVMLHESTVLAPPPDITNMVVSIDGVSSGFAEYYPCDSFTLVYTDAFDPSGLDMTITLTAANVVFYPSVITIGESSVATISCSAPTATPLSISARISNGISSTKHITVLELTAVHGREVIATNGYFTKPLGVTLLSVTGQGGIGVDTTLTGLVNFVYRGTSSGSTIAPSPSTEIFPSLPGEEGDIYVTLAPGTSVEFNW